MIEVNTNYTRINPKYIEAYTDIPPATIGHMDNTRVMTSAITPLFANCKMIGPAFTVRTNGMDYAAINEVKEHAQPGDILVIDRNGDLEHAVIGEFRALSFIRAGIAGCVVDGAVTDVNEIQDMRFPTFSRTISARVAKNIGREGAVGVPVQCGGVIVYPGELIIADDNGIAVISEAEAEEYLEASLDLDKREREWRKQFTEEYKKFQ